MSDQQIDPQLVINDLLDQLKKLTLENSMLRVYIANSLGLVTEPETSSEAIAE